MPHATAFRIRFSCSGMENGGRSSCPLTTAARPSAPGTFARAALDDDISALGHARPSVKAGYGPWHPSLSWRRDIASGAGGTFGRVRTGEIDPALAGLPARLAPPAQLGCFGRAGIVLDPLDHRAHAIRALRRQMRRKAELLEQAMGIDRKNP